MNLENSSCTPSGENTIMLRDKLVMKNFMITPGSSTSQMEQRSSDHIVPDVNDDNIDNGQCHHFSISAYVREMQMNDSNFHSLFDDHINSLLVTTKTFRRWYCESCRDKLEPLYNNTRTPARMLNGVARGLKHDVRKELSQEKGSEECRSPSYNIESMKVDRVVNDSYESTPINQKNGTAKCHSPSWVNKESSDAIPVLNDKDICEKIAEKKEMTNKVKLGFLHGESMLERRNTDNSMKTLPVKRHSIEKKVFKIYKRRKNTKVDCQDTSGMDSTFAHALPSSSSYKSEKAAQIRIEPRNQSALNMIQGRHLHGLIDLWKHTCFTQCEASTGNMPSRCLLPNSYHLHDQYDVENFISYRENNIINESCAPTMDISAKYQHPHCPSKPFRPVPRIGVLSPMLQKEVTTYSESCGTQSGYRLGMSEEEMPCQTYRGGNSASSSQKFRASYNPQHLGYVTSVAIPELLSERENSHSTKGKSKMVYSSDKSPEQDICAVSVSH